MAEILPIRRKPQSIGNGLIDFRETFNSERGL